MHKQCTKGMGWVDGNGVGESGRVTYVEFLEMVRSDAAGLALRPAQLPDYQLQSLWRALDDDGSGFITAKEFGIFMRRGEAAAGGKGATWLELRTAKHRAGAEAMLAERNKERDAMADVPPASDTEMRALAVQLHASMVDSIGNPQEIADAILYIVQTPHAVNIEEFVIRPAKALPL